ncbi:uncharacterized protein LOC141856467 isoform X2 [Brevipalpus obovatus]|uniref:uncharacterized protein LOC141856467 isoform X2 n=1 Tax=Brevipalpus obovatus TaxID=246614 RepID=UPI003D9F245A
MALWPNQWPHIDTMHHRFKTTNFFSKFIFYQLTIILSTISHLNFANAFFTSSNGISSMTANVLKNMNSEIEPTTADNPMSKLSLFGLPYQSASIANMYPSGMSPGSALSIGSSNSMSNPFASQTVSPMMMTQFPSSSSNQWSTALGGGSQKTSLMGSGAYGNDENSMMMLSQMRRLGADQMTPSLLGQRMAMPSMGYGSAAMYSPQMMMSPMMSRYPGMAMMGGNGFYRPYAARRSGRRSPKYRSRHHKSKYREYHTVEPEYSNQIQSSEPPVAVTDYSTHQDQSTAPSETYYKVSTGLTGGNINNKEYLRIGGIGSNILSYLANSLIKSKFGGKSDDQTTSTPASSSSSDQKEIVSDGPFIQFGATRISLKQNSKGGITVTVGKTNSN